MHPNIPTQLASAAPDLIDLDRVAALLHERGVAARLEMSASGAIATLYAGPAHHGAAGDPRYAVVVGPGFYAGPYFTHAWAYQHEMVIGLDDDGEVPPLDTPAGTTDADVAAIVQALIALGTNVYPVTVLAGGDSARRALAALRLSVRDGRKPGDLTDDVLVNLHDVTIGVKRRTGDLYVHLDTSQTPDKVVAVEINGGGEYYHPVRESARKQR